MKLFAFENVKDQDKGMFCGANHLIWSLVNSLAVSFQVRVQVHRPIKDNFICRTNTFWQFCSLILFATCHKNDIIFNLWNLFRTSMFIFPISAWYGSIVIMYVGFCALSKRKLWNLFHKMSFFICKHVRNDWPPGWIWQFHSSHAGVSKEMWGLWNACCSSSNVK